MQKAASILWIGNKVIMLYKLLALFLKISLYSRIEEENNVIYIFQFVYYLLGTKLVILDPKMYINRRYIYWYTNN
jgi:hypothetical protein